MGTDAREGVLTIDLRAIGDNYLHLRDSLAPGSRCGAVVKADAYGLGMVEVAPELYRQGCRDFFVATQTEGEVLSKCLGDDVNIVVLTGVRPGCEAACARARLIPVLFTVQQLRDWVAVSEWIGVAAPCALKFDSGMTRLGMTEEEFEQLLEERELLQTADIRLVLSHLACADDPDHPQNALQLRRFKMAAERLRTLCPDVRLSLANSSGIFLGDAYHFDIARPGCALYGVNPLPGSPNPMRPVVTLQLPVLQKRHLSSTCQVGYGATQQAVAGSCLAVARGGYADGILRAQSGRGCGWACGRRLPMIGRVSMDSTIFDISALSENERDSLQYIEVLNKRLTVDEVAGYAGTIGYEILTSLGSRYHRRYLRS
ncbi:alanine racemase [Microbulbifer thermotolerans]|uniref:alanine racemase n=1 Tax=Microbulbifer thermotolerans TaxID=252514 RepID=UPI00224A4DD3|nr:alanine racemase [Microbulbifer thermotolerans]MCX2784583.1 alanine racemase [Microbulbifer thermotolerans]